MFKKLIISACCAVMVIAMSHSAFARDDGPPIYMCDKKVVGSVFPASDSEIKSPRMAACVANVYAYAPTAFAAKTSVQASRLLSGKTFSGLADVEIALRTKSHAEILSADGLKEGVKKQVECPTNPQPINPHNCPEPEHLHSSRIFSKK